MPARGGGGGAVQHTQGASLLDCRRLNSFTHAVSGTMQGKGYRALKGGVEEEMWGREWGGWRASACDVAWRVAHGRRGKKGEGACITW